MVRLDLLDIHFRDSLSGLGIPGNIWFGRFAVTYILVCRMEVEKLRMMSLPVLTVLGIRMQLKREYFIILSIAIWSMLIFMRKSPLTVP